MIENLNRLYFVAKCVLLNSENKILILKRSDYQRDNTESLWDLPGGNVDLYEDVNVAIRREVKEEVNIVLDEVEVFSIDSRENVKREAFVIFALYASSNFDMFSGIVLSEEHSEYKWIDVSELDDYNFYLEDDRIGFIKDYVKRI